MTSTLKRIVVSAKDGIARIDKKEEETDEDFIFRKTFISEGAIASFELDDFKKEQQNPINSMQTPSDVGEPDSFGKNAMFLGTARTGVVYVYSSCDPAVLFTDLDVTLGADDRCLAHTVGGPTATGTFDDIGRITIPGKSADNVIYFILNNTINSDLQNNFSIEIPIFFRYTPRLTIESSALNDPAAVDPTTGLPLNGVLTVPAFGTKIFSKSLSPGGFETYFDQNSAAASTGFARSYFQALGLRAMLSISFIKSR